MSKGRFLSSRCQSWGFLAIGIKPKCFVKHWIFWSWGIKSKVHMSKRTFLNSRYQRCYFLVSKCQKAFFASVGVKKLVLFSCGMTHPFLGGCVKNPSWFFQYVPCCVCPISLVFLVVTWRGRCTQDSDARNLVCRSEGEEGSSKPISLDEGELCK